VFVSDIRKAGQELGWLPKVGVQEGTLKLAEWVKDHKALF
jgi:nucleoside-diphosphate-sugar epimerase